MANRYYRNHRSYKLKRFMLNKETNEVQATQKDKALSYKEDLLLKMLDSEEFVEAIFSHPNIQARLAKMAENMVKHVDRVQRNVMV